MKPQPPAASGTTAREVWVVFFSVPINPSLCLRHWLDDHLSRQQTRHESVIDAYHTLAKGFDAVVAMNNFGGCFFFLPSRRCVALAGLARECCSLLPSKACTTLVLCVLVTFSMTWQWFGALWVRQCAHEIGFGSAFSSRLTLPRVRDLTKGITRLLPFASVWRDGRRCEMPSQTALMSFAFTAIQTWTWEWQHSLTRGPTITLYTHPEQCLCVAWAGYLTADVAGTILEHAFAQSGMK